MSGKDGRPPTADCNRLWAYSGMVCAYPGCNELLVHVAGLKHTTTGEIAHIHGHAPGSARYKAELLPEQVDTYENCILLCRKHHRIVDGDEARYPVELLRLWKEDHELRHRPPNFSAIESAVATVLPPEAQPNLQRDYIIDRLSVLLGDTRVLVLTGMSGTGKSQIALNYLKSNDSNYTFRGWIRASRLDGVYADLASLAPLLGVVAHESVSVRDVAAAVKLKLEDTPGWLLVVDDASESKVLEILPSKGGHLLVTSKSAAWPCSRYEVDPFSIDDVASLLDRLAIPQIQELVAELVQMVAGHALAIAQAVSYMVTTGMDLTGYIALAKEHRLELLGRTVGLAELSVQAAIQNCIEGLSAEAGNLLKVLSVMASEPVALETAGDVDDLLRSYLPASRLLLEDCVAEIRSFSLIQRDGNRVAVHELVRAVVKASMPVQETMLALLGATHIITHQLPVRTENPDNWPSVELLLPHILEVAEGYKDLPASPPSAMAFFLNRIAPYFQSRGDESLAESLLNQGLDSLESSTGREDLQMKASILTNLATILADRGDLDQASRMQQIALEIKIALPGQNGLSIAVSYSSLGVLAERKGEHLFALEYHEKALPIYRSLGDSARIADCLVDLARVNVNFGELDNARAFAHQAVEEASHAHDAWPDLANAYEVLSRIELEVGDCDAAMRYSSESLRICESPGVDSINLARALAFRGLVLNYCGTPDEACEVLDRSVRVFQIFRHSPDIDMARAEGNLGSALTRAGRPLEARPHLWKSYRDFQVILRDPHPSLTTARVLLIDCASATGDEGEINSVLATITSEEVMVDLLGVIGVPFGLALQTNETDENTDDLDES